MFSSTEMKFESFPALVEAINNDKANAKKTLDLENYQELKQEAFLSELNNKWVGTTGGDTNASYQFGN